MKIAQIKIKITRLSKIKMKMKLNAKFLQIIKKLLKDNIKYYVDVSLFNLKITTIK